MGEFHNSFSTRTRLEIWLDRFLGISLACVAALRVGDWVEKVKKGGACSHLLVVFVPSLN